MILYQQDVVMGRERYKGFLHEAKHERLLKIAGPRRVTGRKLFWDAIDRIDFKWTNWSCKLPIISNAMPVCSELPA